MLSKTALHALRAIIALAEKPGEFQGAATIAERVGAPPNYLSKLLKNLAGLGLLASQKGLGGGFRLQRPPEKITIFDVVEPIDQVSRWSGCFLQTGSCDESHPCPLHKQYGKVRDSYLALLRKTTIADLLADHDSLFVDF